MGVKVTPHSRREPVSAFDLAPSPRIPIRGFPSESSYLPSMNSGSEFRHYA